MRCRPSRAWCWRESRARPALREVDDVAGPHRELAIVNPGRMDAEHVAEDGENPRLVERHPMLDAIAEVLRADGGIVAEVSRGVAIGPSAEVLEHLRKIPMIERDERLDVVLQQLIDDAIVKVDALLIGLALAVRHDARPRERDARGIQPEVGHQRDVVAIAMIEIARDIAGIAVLDLVRACARSDPRSTRPCRPHHARPRFDRTRWRCPTGNSSETRSMPYDFITVRERAWKRL